MPNAPTFYLDEPIGGPCRHCINFVRFESHVGQQVVRCRHPKQGGYFFADAEKGCRFFERETGADDE